MLPLGNLAQRDFLFSFTISAIIIDLCLSVIGPVLDVESFFMTTFVLILLPTIFILKYRCGSLLHFG